MTFTGAFAESRSRLVVASDRMEMTTDNLNTSREGLTDQKWKQLGSQSLMWAWNGSGKAQAELTETLESESFSTWEEGVPLLQSIVSTTNLIAGPNFRLELMIAGYLDGPGIVAVNADGIINWPDFRLGTEARFSGLSSGGVALGWEWIRQRALDDETAFTQLARLAITRDPSLRGITTWEITPEGCRRILCEDTPQP